MIALSDYPRWMFRKNLIEFFVGLGYYLYYSTVAIQLLVYDHMIQLSKLICYLYLDPIV